MNNKRYVIVDLDGTLVMSDMLIESIFLFLKSYPLGFFKLIIWMFKGRAFLKSRLADFVLPDVANLPYNRDIIDYLKLQIESGAVLCLATASDIRIARSVAMHLDIFDYVFGTELVNLSAKHKRDLLIRNFGEKAYEYIGNSLSDLPVWLSASVIHVVNPELGVVRNLKKIGSIENFFDNRPNYIKTLINTIRLHQWVKNLLIFVPMLASHRLFEPQLFFSGFVAFLSFGFCASSVYVLNDLLDLPDDRKHALKSGRSLAAGHLPIFHALILVPLLLIASSVLAILFLPIEFFLVLSIYYILTFTYSVWLKRFVMVDVLTLAILYTTRVVSGALAMSLETTFWILAFCMFIFLSLAFVKRYTELCDARRNGMVEKTSGRGYYPGDFELLASFGVSSGYISVLVLALYINESSSGSLLYHDARWMWLACPILMFWLGRIWILAHRGLMHEDPVVFAIRDNLSRLTGLAFILVFILAIML